MRGAGVFILRAGVAFRAGASPCGAGVHGLESTEALARASVGTREWVELYSLSPLSSVTSLPSFRSEFAFSPAHCRFPLDGKIRRGVAMARVDFEPLIAAHRCAWDALSRAVGEEVHFPAR